MNGIRNLIRFVIVLPLAAFAMHAFAAATHFAISAPSSVVTGTAFSFTVVALDAQNKQVNTYAGTVHFFSSDPAAVLPADSTLTKGKGTFSATLNTVGPATISGTDTATSSITGTSNTISVTGNNVNKHFSLDMAVGSPDNTQTDTLVLATITNDNPSGSNTQIGSFTVSLAAVSGITVTGADGDPNFPGTVVVNSDGSVGVTGIPPIRATQSYTLTLHVKGCGDRNSWSATVWAGNNFSGGTYTDDSAPGHNVTNVPCGNLACNGLVTGASVFNLGIDTSASQRGPYNEDGSPCDGVNYYVTKLAADTTNPYLHFRWSDNQRGAAFFYILDHVATKFGWKGDSLDDVTANPIFVGAQLCDQGANAQFPAPYGKVISDSGGKLIKVDTTSGVRAPPTPPFRIALGPKPMEYMKVEKVSGQTWTVTRGAGATAHAVGTVVMSTPLPPLPTPPAVLTCYDSQDNPLPSCPAGTYQPGAPARMCYVPTDAGHTAIFDIGDGWVPVR